MLRMGSADHGSGACVASAPDVAALSLPDRELSVRHLARNELLFEAGDIKSKIYRVESGALCVYRTRPDLTIEVIEHVLAGDIVGMGFLDRHTTTARATVDTAVRCFEPDAIESLLENDAHNKARYDDAVDREFTFRRDSLASSARERPMVRLAAFLVAVSQRIAQDGGDPTLIDDSVDCGVIADFLGLSVDLLALALMQLEMRGLIETAPPHSLRLKDIPALDAIATEQENAPASWGMAIEQDLREAVR